MAGRGRHAPGRAFVEIKLKDGRTFRGTVLEHGVDTLLFKPKGSRTTQFAFRDIDSLERKAVMSTGKKVGIGVVVAVAATIIGALVIVHLGGEL